MENNASEIAAQLSGIQLSALQKIGEAGDDGLSTFGWTVNWFSVHLMNKRFPDLLTGVLNDDGSAKSSLKHHYVKLTDLGRAVVEARP